MVTFIKAQASALIASLLDFITTIFLTKVIGCWYLLASIIGTLLGGITNFTISRRWVFTQGEKEIPEQILKYMLVWVGYLFLNALGVYVITHYLKVNYVISKMAISITLGTTYNYFLQKRFVFK